ncbi:VOC family protein [Tsuneonella sp. HG094]
MTASAQPTTCLTFARSAEIAVERYVRLFNSVFGASRIESINHFDAYELAELRKLPEISVEIMPTEGVKSIRFVLDRQQFYAVNGGAFFGKFNESTSIYVSCETQGQIDELWADLSRDCLEEQPCGWIKDRYGISWQIVPSFVWDIEESEDRARSARMNVALFRMTKIDIAELRKAVGIQ